VGEHPLSTQQKEKGMRRYLSWSSVVVAAVVVLIAALASTWSVPAQGRPPAQETSLAEAMAQPHGAAHGDPIHDANHEVHQGVDPGAAGVDNGSKQQATAVHTGPDLHPVQPGQLYAKGDYSAGCTVGYGHGKECLPITPPSAGAMGMSVTQMPWTCPEVRTLLPKGIRLDVRGVDPAHLDTNGDGIACDPTD